MRKKSTLNRILSLVLAFCVLVPVFSMLQGSEAYAKNKTLTLGTAKKLALANSDSIETIEMKIDAKKVAYQQAVKVIAQKKKTMSSFRWTPLLSFKFPTQPDYAEGYEFTFQPIQIQYEIDNLEHELNDQKLTEYEKVSKLFVEIVELEETIAFDRERLEACELGLKKNKARIAKKSDIEAMEGKIDSIKEKIATAEGNLYTAKQDLSEITGVDVTTGYTFKNPFTTADIKRDRLQFLTDYTLERDQGFYSACIEEQSARVAVTTSYDLLRNKFGSKTSGIDSYVQQALAGQKFSKKAFKKAYDKFLEDANEPWTGTRKILFFRFKKQWFQGDLDGSRYTDDEPYALYSLSMDYMTARKERDNAEKETIRNVKTEFDTYIANRKTYLNAVTQVEKTKNALDKGKLLNEIGELDYEGYTSMIEDYENAQQDMMSALADYSKSLYLLDRTTCGGITALLGDEDFSGVGADAGLSYVDNEVAEGPYYFIKPIVQNNAFELGIFIPDGSEAAATDFELWCDGTQIGQRTKVGDVIKHLTLATNVVDKAVIRIYDGETFVCDCEIDPQQYSGPLDIITERKIETPYDPVIGAYTYSENTNIGTCTIVVNLNEKNATKYKICTQDGTYLLGDNAYEVGGAFTHLAIAGKNLKDLVIEFYDDGDGLVNKGYFDPSESLVRLIKESDEE